jgi:hypothetical protein
MSEVFPVTWCCTAKFRAFMTPQLKRLGRKNPDQSSLHRRGKRKRFRWLPDSNKYLTSSLLVLVVPDCTTHSGSLSTHHRPIDALPVHPMQPRTCPCADAAALAVRGEEVSISCGETARRDLSAIAAGSGIFIVLSRVLSC